ARSVPPLTCGPEPGARGTRLRGAGPSHMNWCRCRAMMVSAQRGSVAASFFIRARHRMATGSAPCDGALSCRHRAFHDCAAVLLLSSEVIVGAAKNSQIG